MSLGQGMGSSHPQLRTIPRVPLWTSEVRHKNYISLTQLQLGFKTGNRLWQASELVLDLKGYSEVETVFLYLRLFLNGKKVVEMQIVSAIIFRVHSSGYWERVVYMWRGVGWEEVWLVSVFQIPFSSLWVLRVNLRNGAVLAAFRFQLPDS